MNRKEFGKLIAALRREHLVLDVQDNYWKPWTRQQFVDECQKLNSGFMLDTEALSNIENGRRAILSPEILSLMANVLQLTSGERKEFFLAATGLDEKDVYPQYDDTQKTLETLLATMEKIQAPAFIADQYWDILAVNQAIMNVYDMKMENFIEINAPAITKFNMMRILFSPEFDEQKELLGDKWEKFALNSAILFRSSSLRYRATEYFQVLYPALCEFDDFRVYIQRNIKPKDDYLVDNMFINLDNPKYGSIQTISTSLIAATPFGELQLSTFTPLGQESAKIFTAMCKKGNPVFTLLPNWPENRKEFLQS